MRPARHRQQPAWAVDLSDPVRPGSDVTPRVAGDWAYGAEVRFQVLGPVQATVGDAVVEFPGAKERALLARLVLGAGTTVSAAELVDSVWGESPPRTAAKSLQTYVLRLRNSLEPGRNGYSGVLDHRGHRLPARHRAGLGGRRGLRPPGRRRSLRAGRRPAGGGGRDAARGAGSLARAGVRRSRRAGRAGRGPPARGAAGGGAGGPARRGPRAGPLSPSWRPSWNRSSASIPTASGPGRCWSPPSTAAAGRAMRWPPTPGAGRSWSTRWASSRGSELRALHARVLSQDPGLLGTRTRRPVVPAGLALPAGRLVGRDAELAALRTLVGRATPRRSSRPRPAGPARCRRDTAGRRAGRPCRRRGATR